MSLGSGPAAVDVEKGASDEGGFVGGEIADHGGDLFRTTETADGLPCAEFGAYLFFVVLMKFFEVAFDEGRFDCAGTDGIHTEVFGIFDRDLTGHGDDRALGGAVGKALLNAHQS